MTTISPARASAEFIALMALTFSLIAMWTFTASIENNWTGAKRAVVPPTAVPMSS